MTGMHPKIFFRLCLKAIGVMLITWTAPDIVIGLIHACTYPDTSQLSYYTTGSPVNWGTPGPGPSLFDLGVGFLFAYGGSALTAALGLYLFFGGETLVEYVLPPGRRRCPECGYELASKEIERCSECGEMLKKPEPAEQSPG